MTDECDSSFLFKKRHIKIEPDENDDIPKIAPIKRVLPPSSEAPIVFQKVRSPPSCIIPKVVSVKPVSLARVQSPNKNRIDKIALNLKIQQEKKLEKESTTRTLKDCQKILFNNLKNSSFSSEEDESLSNLNWLNKFDLNTTGLTPLSPPLSPRKDDDETDGCFNYTSPQKNIIKFIFNYDLDKKPPLTFSTLIFLAIESSRNKRLCVKDINEWVIENFSYYKNVPSGSWKNSIRHNLSTNQCFSKVDKNLLTMRDFSGKGSLWCINPIYRPMLLDNLNKIGSCYEKLCLLSCLKDKSESPKSDFNNSRASRITQCKPAVINPKIKIVQKAPKITSVKRSSSFARDEECTDMDAVNALLSMKSRARSMPAVDSTKGRRKQLFKPPTRRLDVEDHVDVEDDDLINEMENSDSELIDRFDDESSCDENMLLIDESVCESEEEIYAKRKSNDQNLENVEKKLRISQESHHHHQNDTNPLLELSRAALIVEDQN
ncbi:unnamed protein product [Brachionus calyciflorus]|uniref:Fork-head domain-containing protein n=1 Tax=Brachionus calyciflorus TaxID=104777 RepID=A0A813M7X5_9BILA|nr:unnamed protein product [Brachionus calyciflorus]